MAQQITHFCTIKNKATKNSWKRSTNEYSSVREMLNAMVDYLEANPTSEITLQVRISNIPEQS